MPSDELEAVDAELMDEPQPQLRQDWLAEARAALDRGDSHYAISAALEAQKLDPGLGEAWSIRSRASFQLEQFRDAAFEAREAARLAPNVAQCHVDLGNALDALKQWPDALRAYQAALDLSPRWLDARAGVAAATLEMGRTREGVKLFEAIVRDYPGDRDLNFLLARSLYDDAMARITQREGGWVTVTNLEQARVAEGNASRALRLDFDDQEGLRGELQKLKQLGLDAPTYSWRHSRHLFWYYGAAFVALIVAVAGLGRVSTLIISLLALAACAGTIWLYVKRHRKPKWQWAAEGRG